MSCRSEWSPTWADTLLLVVDQVVCMRVIALLCIAVTEKVSENDYSKCHNQNNAKCPRGVHGGSVGVPELLVGNRSWQMSKFMQTQATLKSVAVQLSQSTDTKERAPPTGPIHHC